MATTIHRACTLYEATCGLGFRVDGDRIPSVRPDPGDPISRRYAGSKAIAIAEVETDPDRVRRPLRPAILASWDELVASLAEERDQGALVLIGRRTLRSNDSWMHDVRSLVSGAERCVLLVHPPATATA